MCDCYCKTDKTGGTKILNEYTSVLLYNTAYTNKFLSPGYLFTNFLRKKIQMTNDCGITEGNEI